MARLSAIHDTTIALLMVAAIPAAVAGVGVAQYVDLARNGPDSCELRNDWTWSGDSVVIRKCKHWGMTLDRADIVARNAFLARDGRTILRLESY